MMSTAHFFDLALFAAVSLLGPRPTLLRELGIQGATAIKLQP